MTANPMAGIQPFRFTIGDDAVDELRRRIRSTRWPQEPAGSSWAWGTDQAYLRELVEYWYDGFDFAAAADRLNAHPQILADVDGVHVHAVHRRSAESTAVPLLMIHGWPGSVLEFGEAVPRLTDPVAHAGAAADAFHVVTPSLPGFGGSSLGSAVGVSPRAIAGHFATLMGRLGYDRFVVQGGDWGSLVASHLAADYPERVLGLHLSIAQPVPPPGDDDPLTLLRPGEQEWVAANARHAATGLGYFAIQRTRPQTLAYALADSPVGWCAWVLDKFQTWTDCEVDGLRDLRNAVSWDDFLTNVSLYWFTDTIASSIRLYREQLLAEGRGEGVPGQVRVPTGVAIYPAEFVKSPRAWMERRFPVVHWYEAPHGGHFAALERPEIFVDDLRAFRAALNDKATERPRPRRSGDDPPCTLGRPAAGRVAPRYDPGL